MLLEACWQVKHEALAPEEQLPDFGRSWTPAHKDRCDNRLTQCAMVQTSLAAWLKKAQPKKDDTAVAESDGASAEPPQPPEPMSSVEERQQLDDQAIQRGHAASKATPLGRLSLKSSSLPPNATLAAITADTLPSFRRMTSLLLPVPYPDKFYNDTINDQVASSISMLALWTDSPTPTHSQAAKPRVVSGIRCRLLANPPGSVTNEPSLYISTITTLGPFRGHGLASALLRRVTARAIREYGIETVTAHMWEANEEARVWYSKHGFKELHYDANYYRKLRPGGAYLLEKKVGPQDLLGVDVDEDEDS
jgi:ribosomal protein S18 acetylase RimI-like enzyme